MKRVALYAVVLIVLQFAFATMADCQAWVSPKGTGSISFSYINNLDNREFFGHGEDFIIVPPNPVTPNGYTLQKFGSLRTQGFYIDLAYSITDKLAVTGSIPYLAPKYNAPAGPTDSFLGAHHFADGSVPLDDGKYHGSFADFAFRVRYNVVSHPFQITPFFQFNQPSHDYLFYSHAIVGPHVHSVAFGTYAGGTLKGFLSNAYVQGSYDLSFPEKVLGVSRHMQQMEGEFGYFFTPAIRGFTILAGQVTHGGYDTPYALGQPDPNNPIFFHHSQITRDNYLNIGFGGQYSFNDRVDFFGLVSHMITARNYHGLTYGITFGFSYGFGGSPQRPCHC